MLTAQACAFKLQTPPEITRLHYIKASFGLLISWVLQSRTASSPSQSKASIWQLTRETTTTNFSRSRRPDSITNLWDKVKTTLTHTQTKRVKIRTGLEMKEIRGEIEAKAKGKAKRWSWKYLRWTLRRALSWPSRWSRLRFVMTSSMQAGAVYCSHFCNRLISKPSIWLKARGKT